MSPSNSRSNAPRAWGLSLAILTLSGVLSGCELDRPNFQMNSNSPIPFFGIDLLPRRRTTSISQPPTLQQMATTEATPGEIIPVDDAPTRHPFWKRNSKSFGRQQQMVILPLNKPHPDQPLDRGPVELMP